MRIKCKLLFAALFTLISTTYSQNLTVKTSTNFDLSSKIDRNYVTHPEYNYYSLDIPVENVELIQLRTETSKTFYGADNLYRVQQTGGIYHYKNTVGEWITIQEKISNKGSEFGIYQSELPIKVDITTGSTKLQLKKTGESFQFGESTSLDFISSQGNVLKTSSSNVSGYSVKGNNILLEDIFNNIDRTQHLNYWDIRTDYIIKESLNLSPDISYIQFADKVKVPTGYSIDYYEGELTEFGWQGSLAIKDELGTILSTISLPKYYDSSEKGSLSTGGRSMTGTYKLEKLSNSTYSIKLIVPASWLNNPNLIYPLIIDPTATNTYASNQAIQDRNTQFSAGCQATMNVTMPATGSYQVTGTNTSYKIWAKGYVGAINDFFNSTDVYADKEEQRSKVGSINGWTAVQAGVGSNFNGPWTAANNSMNYAINNQSIANGCYTNKPTIPYYWQGYQTFLPYTTSGGTGNLYTAGCVFDYHELVTNTWLVTVTYSLSASITLDNFAVGDCLNDLYALTGTVNVTNPPAAGNLIAKTCDGTQITIASSPFNLGSYPLNMTGLNANALPCDIEIYFSQGACSQVLNQTYTAPSCVDCSFSDMTATASGCQPGNTYTLSGTLTFSNAPTTGQLIVEDCSGNTQTFNAPFTSPLNYSINSLTPTGQACTVTAAFTADATCTIDKSYTTPTIPVVVASADVTICQGSSTTISATGATTYSWDNGAGTSASATVSPTNTTTYTVTGTTNGCTATDQVVVTVGSSLTITTSSDLTICTGSSTTLTASGAVTYSWNNGAGTGASVTVSPTTTTTYTVIGTDANGCMGQAQVTVTVAANLSLSATAVAMCEGGSKTITASGATNYTWSPATFLSGNTGATVTFTAGSTTTYTISGSDANGCTGTTTVTATVYPNPTIDAGNDKVLCFSNNVTLSGTGAGTGGNYTWDNGVVNGVAFKPQVGTITYMVTGTTANNCVGTDQVIVTVEEAPSVSFTATQDQYCSPVIGVFTNTSPSTGNCLWVFDNGLTVGDCGPVTQTFSQPGVYGAKLTITSANGCVTSLYQNPMVIVEANPTASFIPHPVVFEITNPVVTFDNQSNGATTYEWDFGDNGASSTQFEPFYKYPEEVASYVVILIAYSEHGCSDTAQYSVRAEEDLLFYVPNAYTPDGDEFNNVFKPIFTSGFDPFDYNLLIFNRWGELVFESNNVAFGWDGIYNATGKMCQDGTYIWKIEFKTLKNDERKIVKGHVNLIR